MNKKGFIFSTDVLFAIMLTFVVLSSVMLLISRESAPPFGAQDLQSTNIAALTAMDGNETLRMSITSNTNTTVQEFLNNATSRNICMNLTISNESAKIQAVYTKQSCPRSSSIVIARRPLQTSAGTHIATLESWYR